MAYQITSLTVVYSTVYSEADQRKHQSSASLAFVGGFTWTDEFPAQRASYAGNVSSWWRHHDILSSIWAFAWPCSSYRDNRATVPLPVKFHGTWASRTILARCVGLCVLNLHISLLVIMRIVAINFVIIIELDIWIISHCLWLGHETMVCSVYPMYQWHWWNPNKNRLYSETCL